MINIILPAILLAMFPADLVAGLSIGSYPTQATLMSLASSLTGWYLARKLWGGKALKLQQQTRLQLISEQGRFFNPESDEVQAQLDNARLNYALGAGFLIFGFLLNVCFIGSYVVTTPIKVTPSFSGTLVQLVIGFIFNLLVIAIVTFGAKMFLKR